MVFKPEADGSESLDYDVMNKMRLTNDRHGEPFVSF